MDEVHPHSDPVAPTPDSSVQNPCESPVSVGPAAPLTPQFDLKLYFMLLAASLLGTLAILPYTATLIKQMDTPIPPAIVPAALAATVVVELLLSAATIAIGLGLGPRVEMGRLFEPDRSTSEISPARKLWIWIGEPLAIGIGLGVIIVLTLSKIEIGGANDKPISTPDAWEGLLASIGAGVREEIWLRFGLLTFCVWLGAKLIRRSPLEHLKLPTKLFWTANLVAALTFAAIHIPQAEMLLGLTGRLLVFVFVGNGVPGIVFGWLYWRRGLVAAMIAHFGLDLVLKVFLPLFS